MKKSVFGIIMVLFLPMILIIGCGRVRSLASFSQPDKTGEVNRSIEDMGVSLLHTVGPGMEGFLRVSNGMGDSARFFEITYEETPIALGHRQIRSLPEEDLKAKIPLLQMPDPPPAYTTTFEVQLLNGLQSHGYEFRAVTEGTCYSPAFLTAYDLVVLLPEQIECISVFRGLGYYVVMFDGDFDALEIFIDEVTQ